MLRIVENACTFDERLSGPYRPSDLPATATVPSFDEWREVVARQDAELFARRLHWDSLDETAARRLLLPVELPDASARPSWANTFAAVFGESPTEVAAKFDAVAGAPIDGAFDAAEPVAFEDLFTPALAYAFAQVQQRVGPAIHTLSEDAHGTMQRGLLVRLSHICSRALYTRFSTFRLTRPRDSVAFIFAPGGRPDAVYCDFVREMRAGELFRFFEEYSVAARLCARVIELWIDATAEFIDRVARDIADIADAFTPGNPVGTVMKVRLDAGDTHDDGRSVIILDFESGLRLVYKPRPIGLEQLYVDIVAWLNQQPELPLQLRAAHVLQRAEYGWIEYVAQEACETTDDARRYYHRTGAILAVVHALNGSDFHFENLIAAGEHPVLIDLEALVMHRFLLHGLVDRQPDSAAAAREIQAQSVLKTGLLPVLHRSQDEWRAIDLGGLASVQDADVPVRVTYWRHLNTDLMKLAEKQVEVEEKANIPRVNGVNQYARDFVPDITAGFEAAYRILLAGRKSLLRTNGILEQLRDQRVRFLFRQTNLYATLLERALHPAYLRAGAARFVQLDVLSRPLLAAQERPVAWAVLQAERASLEQLDIPCFSAHAGSTSLTLPSGTVLPDFFERSAYDEVVSKVEQLDLDNMEFQLELLRMALYASTARGAGAPFVSHAEAFESSGEDARDIRDFRSLAHEEANAVAHQLRTRAIRAGGEATWFGIGYLPRTRRHVVGPMAYTLADGYCGVALFLAALARCAQSDTEREFALAAIHPLRNQLAQFRTYTTTHANVDIGIANGLGSAVYAFTRIARLIDEPALLDDAGEIAAVLTPELISRDVAFDVSAGTAGALLALLTHYQATSDSASLATAIKCGSHLLDHAIRSPGVDGVTWRTAGSTSDVGFAHGAAGISVALARLARATGDAAYAKAAEQAIAYDRAQLAINTNGGWANGATGLALAELELGYIPARSESLQRALDTARQRICEDPDGLASGALGSAELLLSAGCKLGDMELVDFAAAGAARVVERARRRGYYGTGWGSGFNHFGLYHGLPGIAYELLRLSAPRELPSVLTWQ